MPDRTISLRISADIQDLQGKLRKASNDMRSFAGDASRSIRQNRAEWAGLSTQVGLIGGVMVAAAGLAVKGFADFDKSMSKVKASGADAAANLSSLRDAAVQAGADTQYSAAEAADAITDLAKAGVSAKDILGGGLAGSLALAAAGEMDVKEAAETTAVALTQFRLAGSQSSHVADLLAAGAGKAMGEVTDLGMALKQSGLVANQVGMSIEETVGALSSFAAAGMLGSDAGTSLKTMLQRLTPQSAEAQKQFDKLGISAYDSQGQFVGLSEFAGQLQTKMSKLTPEARNSAMAVMFGADAVRAANVLYSEGAAGVEEWTKAVNDQGFASMQAAILTDNLSGDLERLRGSLDTVFIQSGSGANDALRGLTQGATAAVNAFGELPGPILSAGAALTGAGGLGLVGAAGVMKIVGAVGDARESFAKLGKAATLAKVSVAGVGAALAIGTLALSAWASKTADTESAVSDFASTMVVVNGAVMRTDSTLSRVNEQLVESKVGMWNFADVGFTIQQVMDKLGVSTEDAIGYLNGNADAIDRVRNAQDAWMYTQGDNLARSYDLMGALDEINVQLSESEKRTLAKYQADQAAGVGAATYADALLKQAGSTEDGSSALAEYTKKMWESANAALALSGTHVGWEAALDDTSKAIEKNGKAARTAAGDLDLNTKRGRDNQTALNQLATSSVAYASKLMEQGASEDKVQGVMERTRKSFIKQATAAGMSETAAAELADAYGLIPSDVRTSISVIGGDKSATKLAMVQAAIQGLPPEQQVHVLSEFDKGGIDDANAALRKISGKTVTTYVATEYMAPGNGAPAGSTRKAATGGPVWGAGTETSDSIPALLSNNEHVWTAAEVRAAGGHGRVQRLRAAALSGDLPRFAKGGAARKNAAARAELLAELQTSVRRGTITADVLGGSGLSVVDELLDWAANTALSKSARSKLSTAAAGYEASLSALSSQLETAKATLANVKAVYDDVYSTLSRSGSKLSDLSATTTSTTMHSDAAGNVWYSTETTTPTAAGIASKKAGEAGRLVVLGGKLQQLQKMGANTAFLSEIAGLADSPEGVENAIRTADLFLADRSSIATMNSAYDELSRYSAGAAQFVTESAYAGGLSAAQGVVDSLNGSLSALGTQMASSFAEALGEVVVGTTVTAAPVAKKSTKKKAVGGPVAAGELYQVNEQGVEMFRPYVSGVILTASQTQQAIGSGGPVSAYLTDAQMQQLALMVVAASSRITTAVAADQAAKLPYATGGW